MNIESLKLLNSKEVFEMLPDEKVVKGSLKSIKSALNGEGVFKDATLSEEVIEDACSLSGVPFRFFNKCDVQLKSQIMDKFFKPETTVNFVISNNIVKFLSVSQYVPFRDIFSIFAERVKPIGIQYPSIDDPHILNFITNENKSATRVKNDVTHIGVTLKMSPSITHGSLIETGPFLLRLICTNGMLEQEDRLERWNSRDFNRGEIESGIERSLVTSKRILDQFLETEKQELKDPTFVLHKICTEGRVREPIQRKLLNQVPTLGNKPTLYDVLNMVTSYANTLKLGDFRRLQFASGSWVAAEATRCPACKAKL